MRTTNLSDEQLTFNSLLMSANEGDASAQYKLGCCYASGSGTRININNALHWLQCAARQEHAGAQYKLGCCYASGFGIKKNKMKAFLLYQKAAEQGHAGAQYKLGYYYLCGSVIKKDLNQAFLWFQKAANQGDLNAQFKVGVKYISGNGIDIDESIGLEYIHRAAKQNHVEANLWIDKIISVTPNDMLEEVSMSTDSFMPTISPNLVDQKGPERKYCLSAVFAEACKYTCALDYEKEETREKLNEINEDIVLEQLKYINPPLGEPLCSIVSLALLSKHYKIKNFEAIILGTHCTEKTYTNAICESLRNNNILILVCNQKNLMPYLSERKQTDMALCFGYWRDVHNNVQLAVTHRGFFCKWSMHALYESNMDLSVKKSSVKNCFSYPSECSFFKMKVKNNRKLIEHTPSEKIIVPFK